MSINLNNLAPFVRRETVKAVREVLRSHLNEDDERTRQERMAAEIEKRKLQADDKKEASEDVDEAEAEEDEDEAEEAHDTGVPSPETVKTQDRSGGKGTADSPKLDTPTLKQIEKPSPEAVIDKLNALRGGKSLKDAAVRKSFEQYFKALGHQEKETLLIYLTAIAQILAGVTSGADAIEPSDVGIQTKEPEKVHAKHKSKKPASPVSKEDRPGTEAIPIVVGEQQRKQGIMKILEAYKNLS